MIAPYRTTPVFDETTLPEGLRREHRTRAGVWGVIRVLDGRLSLTFHDKDVTVEVTSAAPALVLPNQPHSVTPLGPMRMQVAFYEGPPGVVR